MDETEKRVMESIRSRKPLCEPFVKLSLILDVGGADMYLSSCGDRVADAELIDGEDVRIDFANFPDMDLTAKGMRACRDILQSYVSDAVIADVQEALLNERERRKSVNVVSRTLRGMGLPALVRACTVESGRMRRLVAAELWQRFPPVGCFRRARDVYYTVLVRVKYRWLFFAIGGDGLDF